MKLNKFSRKPHKTFLIKFGSRIVASQQTAPNNDYQKASAFSNRFLGNNSTKSQYIYFLFITTIRNGLNKENLFLSSKNFIFKKQFPRKRHDLLCTMRMDFKNQIFCFKGLKFNFVKIVHIFFRFLSQNRAFEVKLLNQLQGCNKPDKTFLENETEAFCS